MPDALLEFYISTDWNHSADLGKNFVSLVRGILKQKLPNYQKRGLGHFILYIFLSVL